jgi:hypothetical protein
MCDRFYEHCDRFYEHCDLSNEHCDLFDEHGDLFDEHCFNNFAFRYEDDFFIFLDAVCALREETRLVDFDACFGLSISTTNFLISSLAQENNASFKPSFMVASSTFWLDIFPSSVSAEVHMLNAIQSTVSK